MRNEVQQSVTAQTTNCKRDQERIHEIMPFLIKLEDEENE